MKKLKTLTTPDGNTYAIPDRVTIDGNTLKFWKTLDPPETEDTFLYSVDLSKANQIAQNTEDIAGLKGDISDLDFEYERVYPVSFYDNNYGHFIYEGNYSEENGTRTLLFDIEENKILRLSTSDIRNNVDYYVFLGGSKEVISYYKNDTGSTSKLTNKEVIIPSGSKYIAIEWRESHLQNLISVEVRRKTSNKIKELENGYVLKELTQYTTNDRVYLRDTLVDNSVNSKIFDVSDLNYVYLTVDKRDNTNILTCLDENNNVISYLFWNNFNDVGKITDFKYKLPKNTKWLWVTRKSDSTVKVLKYISNDEINSSYITIVSSSSRNKGDYYCNGTNDEVIINQAINDLPKATFKTPSGSILAPYGKIYFSDGVFKISCRIEIPRGSRILIEGSGRSYQDIDFGGDGGTVIASYDENGALYCPYISGYGDSQTLVIRDLDFRQDIPLNHNASCVDMVGVMSGGLENVGIINDKTITGLNCQDGNGLYFNNGSLGNTCWIRDVDVGSFGINGRFTAVIGSNHIIVDNLHLNGGNGNANALKIATWGDRCSIRDIHFFQYKAETNNQILRLIHVDALSSAVSNEIITIENMSYESIRKNGQNTFITHNDNKSKIVIHRVHDNDANENINILYNAYDFVKIDYWCGKNEHSNQSGYNITQPIVPTNTNDVVKNIHPFDVLVVLDAQRNVKMIGLDGTEISLNTVSNFILPKTYSVKFNDSLPTTWNWYGM